MCKSHKSSSISGHRMLPMPLLTFSPCCCNLHFHKNSSWKLGLQGSKQGIDLGPPGQTGVFFSSGDHHHWTGRGRAWGSKNHSEIVSQQDRVCFSRDHRDRRDVEARLDTRSCNARDNMQDTADGSIKTPHSLQMTRHAS